MSTGFSINYSNAAEKKGGAFFRTNRKAGGAPAARRLSRLLLAMGAALQKVSCGPLAALLGGLRPKFRAPPSARAKTRGALALASPAAF